MRKHIKNTQLICRKEFKQKKICAQQDLGKVINDAFKTINAKLIMKQLFISKNKIDTGVTNIIVRVENIKPRQLLIAD